MMELFLVIFGVICWYVIKVYNNIKPLEISIKESDSNIKVLLQKRTSILNKLNYIVTTYSKYEKDMIVKVSDDMKNNGTSFLTINRLYDAYPDLKLNETFQEQIERLYDIESERQTVIEYYNNKVRDYNEEVTSFPAILVCHFLSFKEKRFFI